QEELSENIYVDPACGSGNFLTETYISLRRLENKVLSELAHQQTSVSFDDLDISPIKISLDQFYGLEINDFAVSVAGTALWIAELQANLETEMIVTRSIESLPLSKDSRIIHGNALETDWATVLAPENCDYIIGNPPFLGARNQSPAQTAEVRVAFTAIGATRNLGKIDYIGAWFAAAARYMGDHPVGTAFVATNSVCQGEQVANIWHPIHELGVHMDFVHNNFRWGKGAKDPANVICLVVGFSYHGVPKALSHYPTVASEPEVRSVKKLNPYLEEADNIFVWTRSTPICDVPSIGIGSQLIDFGHYTFTPQEKADFLEKEPQAEKYFYRLSGGREFLNGIERWVLWLGEITLQDLQQMPMVRERIEAVRERRSSVKRRQTREAANTPHRFGMEVIP